MRPNVKYASLGELYAFKRRDRLTLPRRSPTIGLAILVAYMLFLGLFMSWMLSAPPAQVKDCGIEGTDWYYECTTGEAIDLSPIQDEADALDTERGQP